MPRQCVFLHSIVSLQMNSITLDSTTKLGTGFIRSTTRGDRNVDDYYRYLWSYWSESTEPFNETLIIAVLYCKANE